MPPAYLFRLRKESGLEKLGKEVRFSATITTDAVFVRDPWTGIYRTSCAAYWGNWLAMPKVCIPAWISNW